MRKRTPPKSIEYNPVIDPKHMHGYLQVRWVENASCGLRLVGYADEITKAEGNWRSIDHKGWYITEDGCGGETYRGIVYQLPSRGEPQYVYGYADPNNDDCALLCFDVETDKMDAARAADLFAEIFAREARDYDRAWQAGRRYEDLAEEVKTTRKEALALCAEIREARKTGVQSPQSTPSICAALRDKVLSLYRSIQKMREERAKLLDDYGRQLGFVE
jgi:hypothetical protein